MTGEARFVDINIELPIPHKEGQPDRYIGVTAQKEVWEYLCDCGATCEIPRDSSYYALQTNACDSPIDNCCNVTGAIFKCPKGSDCCAGFCCPPNSACQKCGGVAQCSAPTA